ncbi:MAG: hypothetical protein WHT06_12125 [Desulfobacterales bacterium]
MIRIIVILLACYLAWRLIRGYLQKKGATRSMPEGPRGRIDDVMVKDPHCGTYVARRDGVTVKTPEGELVFCSPECRDKYLADRERSEG